MFQYEHTSFENQGMCCRTILKLFLGLLNSQVKQQAFRKIRSMMFSGISPTHLFRAAIALINISVNINMTYTAFDLFLVFLIASWPTFTDKKSKCTPYTYEQEQKCNNILIWIAEHLFNKCTGMRGGENITWSNAKWCNYCKNADYTEVSKPDRLFLKNTLQCYCC